MIDAYRLLVDQTRIQISDQIQRFEGFRSKSFTSLAASGTVAAFFGGRLTGVSTGLRWGEITSFAATALLAVVLIWPSKFAHGIGPVSYYGWLQEHSADKTVDMDLLDSTTRDVVESWRKNEKRIFCATCLFAAQCIALAAQLTMWVLILHETH